MSIVQVVVFFLVLWWMILFITLPFGIQREENPEPGTDPGAPSRSRIKLKMAITTAIAVTVTLAIYTIVEAGWLPLDVWLRGQ